MLCSADLLLPGPWEHREVGANGFRFHVALGERFDELSGSRSMIILIPGLAQCWYAWRHVLPQLDAAGHPAAILDPRGVGSSDQPPRGYDAATQAEDVAEVVVALGGSRAVIIGHDVGGALAWATAIHRAERVQEVITVSCPAIGGRLPWLAPLASHRWSHGGARRGAARFLGRRSTTTPDPVAVELYQAHLAEWPGAARVISSYRGLRRWLVAAEEPGVPRYRIEASLDRHRGREADLFLPGVGRLAPEEAPEAVSAAVLARLPST